MIDEQVYLSLIHSVHNVDGIAKVTGRATYTFDVKLPGMLYGKILRSPHPHAKILNIDYSKALELPGVVRCCDRQETPRGQAGDLAALPGSLRRADPPCRQGALHRRAGCGSRRR